MATLDRRTFLTATLASKALSDTGLFSDGDLRAIDRENAVRLLPRFAA